jgi:quercetin dioxygenase-like cupin family protein
VRPGDVVWNPLTGEKALLIESPEENEGARAVFEFAVEPGGFVPGGEHVHDHCTEHFELEAGQATFLVDGRERALGAGDRLTVAPGTWHRWWNSDDGEMRARVRVEPALALADMILTAWGLCADGHTDSLGRPSPLFGALVATRYRREIRFRRPPDLAQRLLLPALAAIARRRGRDRVLDRYLDPATHPSAEAGSGRLPDRVMRRG